MTVERRVVFGLDDIKALSFQCKHNGCGARLSVLPEKFDIETIRVCPACHRPWLPPSPASEPGRVDSPKVSAYGAFMEGLRRLRLQAENGVGFILLFQFEEPPH